MAQRRGRNRRMSKEEVRSLCHLNINNWPPTSPAQKVASIRGRVDLSNHRWRRREAIISIQTCQIQTSTKMMASRSRKQQEEAKLVSRALHLSNPSPISPMAELNTLKEPTISRPISTLTFEHKRVLNQQIRNECQH